jgi:putative redox protein
MGKHLLATFVDPAALRVEADTQSGHRIVLDGGYGPDGPGPTEVLLAALAGCTSMDVASILRKKRQAVGTYQIAVEAEQAEQHPRVFTRIVIEHRVAGDVTAEALRRSIELSATKYCPVNAMLSAGVQIEHRYRLERPDEEATSALVVTTGPTGAEAALAS